jgi:hypothetical protein
MIMRDGWLVQEELRSWLYYSSLLLVGYENIMNVMLSICTGRDCFSDEFDNMDHLMI